MLRNDQSDIQLMRVVVFEEEDMFVARCLEKNIGAQGKDLNELFHRLCATLFLEAPNMGDIEPAPKQYFDMWESPDQIPVPVGMPLDARMVAA